MFRSDLNYVGDWHTHPEEYPRPSATDLASINETFRKSTHNLSAFLLVIAGTSTNPEGLYVAVSNGTEVVPLQRDLGSQGRNDPAKHLVDP